MSLSLWFALCSQFSPINFDVTAVTSGKGTRETVAAFYEALLIFSERKRASELILG